MPINLAGDVCVNNGKTGISYTEYALHTENVQHIIDRSPIVFAVPGSEGEPQVMGYDLGLLQQMIIISGVVYQRSAEAEPNGGFPNHRDLATFIRLSANDSSVDTLSQSNPRIPRLSLPSMRDDQQEIYGGFFQNLEMAHVFPNNTWTFKVKFAVIKSPGQITWTP